MNFDKFCFHCMTELEMDSPFCPNCGFNRYSYCAPENALKPAGVLKGNYLLGNVIGSGGFGITYIALDLSLERVVAIKEFFVEGMMYRGDDQIAVFQTISEAQRRLYELNQSRFIQEAQMLAYLKNLPGIVQVYDLFQENGTNYFVMEYISGKTLQEYVESRNHRMNFDEIYHELRPIMISLQKIHKENIIHRDISPDNLKYFNEDTLKLLDFGGAKQSFASENSAIAFRKKGYTPIEMYGVDGEQGAWTDIYALAATIYYCISGIVPEEAINRIENDSLKKPSNLGAVISPSQEAVLMKALSIRGIDRYQTMEEFIEALDFGDANLSQPGSHTSAFQKILPAIVGTMFVGAIAGIAVFGGPKIVDTFLEKQPIEDSANYREKKENKLLKCKNGSSLSEYLTQLENSGFTLIMASKNDCGNMEALKDKFGIMDYPEYSNEDSEQKFHISIVKIPVNGDVEVILDLNMISSEMNGAELEYIAKSNRDGEVIVSSPNEEQIVMALETDIAFENNGNYSHFYIMSTDDSISNDLEIESANINTIFYTGVEKFEMSATDSVYENVVISLDGENYAPDEAGMNIVVYDEMRQKIVDSLWIAPEDNRVISKK